MRAERIKQVQTSCCGDCDDEEPLPKQVIKIEIPDDEDPAPTKTPTTTSSQPNTALPALQVTNIVADTKRSKEREKAKLMLELEEIRIKKRLMELEY